MSKNQLLSKNEYHNQINTIKIKKNDKIKTNLKFNILILSVNSCLNVGNIMRTSNLTGVDKIFIFGKRRYEKKSAVTVHKYCNVYRINEDFPDGIDENIIENKKILENKTKIKLDESDYIFNTELFINTMKKFNQIPIFVEQSEKSIKLSQIRWKYVKSLLKPEQSYCFVFGNEHYGIPKNILDTVDLFENSFILELEQVGYINSFNVSNTASIVLNSFFIDEVNSIKNKYFL